MNIQQNFRYYLAFVLAVLLAVGVRNQAAPLGMSAAVTEAPAPAPAPAAKTANAPVLASLR
jgi:hypothetical protein